MAVRLRYPTRQTKQIDVIIGNLTLYFSYETVIAFDSPYSGFVISKNVWSTTTGRHLNEINSLKHNRIPHAEFLIKLSNVLQNYGLEG